MKVPKLAKPNFKKPELKRPKGQASSLKAPKPVADLYADLRDRRLLPLVALLLVAILAVPFLLADNEPAKPLPAVTPPPATQAAAFEVVPAKPELRDYRKRLEHRKRESPFSTYAAARLSNETREEVEGVVDTLEGGGAEETTAESTTTTTTTETGATEYAPSQPPVVQATVKANIGYEAVLKTEFVGDTEPKEQSIEAQAKLPNEDNPAIVYTGISPDKSGGLFLMTSNVTAFYGHGQCVLGGATCQQIKLKVGKSATFAIGYGETRYKVTLLGFTPIIKEAKVERGG